MSATLALVALSVGLWAGDGPSPDEHAKTKLDALRTYYAETAARYAFEHDGERKEPLKLVNRPVMSWATADDWSGDLFVWTRQGRPEVIGSIMTGPETKESRKVVQEFHLLTDKPVNVVKAPGPVRWNPTEGLEFRALERAPKPAETAPLRLSQMRQLMRGFTAHMESNRRESHLRLLTQPLMRFQPTEGVAVDGALFAYVWPDGGTDPELILVMECRKSEHGVAWFYAPARFTTRTLWLEHGKREVWRCGSLDGEPQSDLSRPYFCGTLEMIPESPASRDDVTPAK